MKATEQYFPVVPFGLLYKAVLTFVFIHIKATEQYLPVYYAVQGGLNV